MRRRRDLQWKYCCTDPTRCMCCPPWQRHCHYASLSSDGAALYVPGRKTGKGSILLRMDTAPPQTARTAQAQAAPSAAHMGRTRGRIRTARARAALLSGRTILHAAACRCRICPQARQLTGQTGLLHRHRAISGLFPQAPAHQFPTGRRIY